MGSGGGGMGRGGVWWTVDAECVTSKGVWMYYNRGVWVLEWGGLVGRKSTYPQLESGEFGGIRVSLDLKGACPPEENPSVQVT